MFMSELFIYQDKLCDHVQTVNQAAGKIFIGTLMSDTDNEYQVSM